MKNILLSFLFLSLTFGFYYCGNENKEEPVPETPTREETLANYIKFGLNVDQILDLSENFTLDELLEAGVSISDLVEAESVDLADLKIEGITPSQLYLANAHINDLYEAGYTLEEIKNGGYPLADFVDAGFEKSSLIDLDFGYNDLIDAGLTIKDFNDKGISIHELVQNEVSLPKLAIAGATVKDIIEEDFTIDQLIIAGIPINKISGTSLNQENNSFTWIGIGNQVWMTENLDVTTYNDHSSIPLIVNSSDWDNRTTPAYCWYDNNISNGDKYGALYNWHTVETGKLCPIGWHVPSLADWSVLTNYLGGESVAGGKIKDPNEWTGPVPSNESGFSAVPAGVRDVDGEFEIMGSYTYWWASSIVPQTDKAWDWGMYNQTNRLYQNDHSKSIGESIRCIKD